MQRQEQLGGGQPDGAAQVQQLGPRPEDGGDDRGVAGHPPHRLGGQQVTGQRRPGPGQALQVLVVHRDHHRGLRGGRRCSAGGGGTPADLDQRVRAALVAGAEVRPGHRRRLRRGQRAEDRLQHGLALGVQPQPVLGHPVIGVRLGQGAAVLEQVLPALELTPPPIPGDQPRSQRPDLGRPVGLGDRHEPGQHRLRARRGQPRQQLVHLGQRDRGVADRDPRGQDRLGQRGVARLGDRLGHLHQRSRATGPVGRPPGPDPPGRRRRIRGSHVAAGQRLVQHPDLTRAGQALHGVQLGEHRPQLVRPELVQPAQYPAQHRRDGEQRRLVLLKAGPLHEPKSSRDHRQPLGTRCLCPQPHRRTGLLPPSD